MSGAGRRKVRRRSAAIADLDYATELFFNTILLAPVMSDISVERHHWVKGA